MKHKPLFSFINILVACIFSSCVFAQNKSTNEAGAKLKMLNKRAYYQFEIKGSILLTDSVSIERSFPREKIYELQQAKAAKGMDIPEAVLKVLGKNKNETFPIKRIFFDGMVNQTGKIVKLTIGVPVEYQISLEDCARLIEFVKNNVTIDVPKGKQGMFGSFAYGVTVSFLKGE